MGLIFRPGSSNGTIINGVAHFVQPTKPLTRINGSPLVTDDKWYNITDNVDCFFNGTYWLSIQLFRSGAMTINTGTPSTYTNSADIDYNGLILVTGITSSQYYGGGTYNNTNYWTQRAVIKTTQSGSNDQVTLHNAVEIAKATGRFYLRETINLVVDVSEKNQFGMLIGRVGTPSNFSGGQTMTYRLIY